jgi:hypothetical protein
MGRLINDEFSGLSPQLAYQRRHKRDGLCHKCSNKARKNGLCQLHIKSANRYYEEVIRPRRGMINRYKPRKKVSS